MWRLQNALQRSVKLPVPRPSSEELSRGAEQPVQGQPPAPKQRHFQATAVSPPSPLALILAFGLLSSVPQNYHPRLSLPCNGTGHVRAMKGERPQISKSSCKSDYKNKLGVMCWEAKRLWKGRRRVQGDTWLIPLGQARTEELFPWPLGLICNVMFSCSIKLNHLRCKSLRFLTDLCGCHNAYRGVNVTLSNISMIKSHFSPAR